MREGGKGWGEREDGGEGLEGAKDEAEYSSPCRELSNTCEGGRGGDMEGLREPQDLSLAGGKEAIGQEAKGLNYLITVIS